MESIRIGISVFLLHSSVFFYMNISIKRKKRTQLKLKLIYLLILWVLYHEVYLIASMVL